METPKSLAGLDSTFFLCGPHYSHVYSALVFGLYVWLETTLFPVASSDLGKTMLHKHVLVNMFQYVYIRGG